MRDNYAASRLVGRYTSAVKEAGRNDANGIRIAPEKFKKDTVNLQLEDGGGRNNYRPLEWSSAYTTATNKEGEVVSPSPSSSSPCLSSPSMFSPQPTLVVVDSCLTGNDAQVFAKACENAHSHEHVVPLQDVLAMGMKVLVEQYPSEFLASLVYRY